MQQNLIPTIKYIMSSSLEAKRIPFRFGYYSNHQLGEYVEISIISLHYSVLCRPRANVGIYARLLLFPHFLAEKYSLRTFRYNHHN